MRVSPRLAGSRHSRFCGTGSSAYAQLRAAKLLAGDAHGGGWGHGQEPDPRAVAEALGKLTTIASEADNNAGSFEAVLAVFLVRALRNAAYCEESTAKEMVVVGGILKAYSKRCPNVATLIWASTRCKQSMRENSICLKMQENLLQNQKKKLIAESENKLLAVFRSSFLRIGSYNVVPMLTICCFSSICLLCGDFRWDETTPRKRTKQPWRIG